MALAPGARASFCEFFKGDEWNTYTHHSGTKHRIDFICIPQASRHLPQISRAIDIGYSNAIADHDAVMNDVSLCVSCSRPVFSQIKYDTSLFESELHARHFRDIIDKASFNLHFWDNTSMVSYFNKYVLWALSIAFPMERMKALKP